MVHITLLASTVLAFIKHHKKSLISVSFLLIFIFSALRYGFGNDYFSYMNIFNTIKITGWHSYLSTNALFILLNKFAPNFQMVIAITSAMFLIPVYFLIVKNVEAKYHVISLGIFLFHPYLFIVNLSAIRQSIAAALFICAVYMAMKKMALTFMNLMKIQESISTILILI